MSTLQKIKFFEDTVSVTDLRKNLKSVYTKLEKDHELVITKKQDVLGVLIDKKTYEKKEKLIKNLKEKIEYYEIQQGITKAKESDKTYTEKEMREKLNL